MAVRKLLMLVVGLGRRRATLCPVSNGYFGVQEAYPLYLKSRHSQCSGSCPLRANSGHASTFGVDRKLQRLRALSLGRDLALYRVNVTLEKFLRASITAALKSAS